MPTAAVFPPLVARVDVWGVPWRAVPAAIVAMATDRRIRRRPGVSFAKMLGTGDGRTFTARDADLHHWALLTCCVDEAAARALDADPVLRRWAARSEEHLRLLLTPLAARGRWSGREPFGREPFGRQTAGTETSGTETCATETSGTGTARSPARRWDGPVVAITRARLRPGRMRRFWSAVPPVSASLRTGEGGPTAGPLFAIGIGEAPIGLQGTLSVWSGSAALTTWAYRRPEHLAAVRATPEEGWYAEELFARFRLLAADGTFEGVPLAVAAPWTVTAPGTATVPRYPAPLGFRE